MKSNTYKTGDGASFTATSPADLMRQLRLDSWNPEDSEEAYRLATARAAELQTGKPHRDASAKVLVEDMIASGLIRIEEEGRGAEISHD